MLSVTLRFLFSDNREDLAERYFSVDKTEDIRQSNVVLNVSILLKTVILFCQLY